MSNSSVVVGIDGSSHGRAALQWAANEANLRKCELLVIHAFDSPWSYWSGPTAAVPMEDVEKEQQRLLAAELDVVTGQFPGLTVNSEIVNDFAARTLIDRSEDAALVVVGSRGKGGFSGLLLGSVSQQVVQHAHCPVVVVHEDQQS